MSEESVNKQIEKIFVNPQVQAAVVDAVVGNKPKGWSRRSNAPYYKERYGIEMKEIFDGMVKDRLDRCYDYGHFQDKLHMARETVYMRVNQAMRYLIDHMDDAEHTYARFAEMIRVERVRGVGVMIRFIPEFRESDVSSFVPKQVIPRERVPIWEDQMLEWLENSPVNGKPFFVDKLALTSEKIAEIKLSLRGLKNVISSITAHSVKLVKTAYEVKL